LSRHADLRDLGDVGLGPPDPRRDPETGVIDPRGLERMVGAVADRVSDALADERLPVVVGGDCPVLLGALLAARRTYGEIGLLFVDGHEDAWPPHDSTTGEAADMELGLALGATRLPPVSPLAALLPLLRPEHVQVFGPRDRAEIDAAGVPSLAGTVAMLDEPTLQRLPIERTVWEAAGALHAATERWWLHVDLDVLATGALPAVDYRQLGGLDWSQLDALSARALTERGVAGWTITIYNPDLDPTGVGARHIVAYVERVGAALRSG
jgi:arginase